MVLDPRIEVAAVVLAGQFDDSTQVDHGDVVALYRVPAEAVVAAIDAYDAEHGEWNGAIRRDRNAWKDEALSLRERIAAEIEAEADPNVVGDYGMGHNAGTYQAARIARGETT